MTFDDISRHEDSSWDAIWESAGKINEQGYVVEFAIPLNQLRFAEGLEQQVWGIDLLRFFPGGNRQYFDESWMYPQGSYSNPISVMCVLLINSMCVVL